MVTSHDRHESIHRGGEGWKSASDPSYERRGCGEKNCESNTCDRNLNSYLFVRDLGLNVPDAVIHLVHARIFEVHRINLLRAQGSRDRSVCSSRLVHLHRHGFET